MARQRQIKTTEQALDVMLEAVPDGWSVSVRRELTGEISQYRGRSVAVLFEVVVMGGNCRVYEMYRHHDLATAVRMAITAIPALRRSLEPKPRPKREPRRLNGTAPKRLTYNP